MDGIGTPLCGDGGSVLDIDPFMLSAFDDLDSYTEFGAGPSVADSSLSAFSFSPGQQLLHMPASLPHSVNSDEQSDASITVGSDCSTSLASGELLDMSTATVPWQIHGVTLSERLLRALAMLKEATSGEAILVQVWMPVRNGEHRVLTTSDQPFLLDERLTGYREVSRQYTFSATEGPGLFPGLPGRVFLSGMLEWTSNVMYYSSSEYLRVQHAICHEIRGSLALPVFDPSADSCCAVLEVVMMQEKDNFCSEIDDICNALQSVHLSTVKACLHPQSLTRNQESAFMEILDVLRAACHAHMLPLALAWVPLCSSNNAYVSGYGDQAINFCLREKDILCIQESACYVHDIRMHDFVRACAEHPLKKGQGVAGNAILSNNPFFSSDVRDYDTCDYPLAHHVRKCGLHAAVAIRLRSTLTGDDDYVLEYFLPLMCKGSEEQQLLLDDISVTMQRVCKSLRTVSDAELMEDARTKSSKGIGSWIRCPLSGISISSGCKFCVPSEIETDMPSGNEMNTNEQLCYIANKLKPSTTSHGEKRRSSTQKNVSLSVLKQYFAGSLRDAAKSIGVCPTTLKRICRQHGISRWPSRKIKKVNRSLKKIQNMISSVQGVEGDLKYDPATGCLISSVTVSDKPLEMHVESDSSDPLPFGSEFSELKFGPDAYQGEHQGQHILKVQKGNFSETGLNLNERGLFQNSHSTSTSNGSLSADTTSSIKTDLWIAGSQNKDVSRDSIFLPTQCKMEAETENMNIRKSIPSSSSMTDCSSGSASSHGTLKRCFKAQSVNEGNMAIIVKANYKDDTVRFRLLPTMKYQHLLEEIAKRLKLLVGTFQLKYRDDEDEWVILASDADLQECLDILDTIGSHILKVQVRDVPQAVAPYWASRSGCCCKN